jgi:hypothetical protein
MTYVLSGGELKGLLNKRTFETNPPLTGHTSNQRLGFIPLYGGVARSAGGVAVLFIMGIAIYLHPGLGMGRV